MQLSHTPIDSDGYYRIWTDKNTLFAKTTDEYTAKLIVACVNACAGINPEAVPGEEG